VAFGPGRSDDQQPAEVEYVQFGSPRERRRGGWLPRLVLTCLVIAVAVTLVGRAFHRSAPAPAPAPQPPPLPPVSVLRVGHPILGVTAGWELFGLNQANVVAIQFARGRIVSTPLPPPEGSGPVSFLAGPQAAIVRPMDNAPGYLVPEGDQARPLTGALAAGDLLLPGPWPSQEWVVGGNSSTLSLVTSAGRTTSVHITLPPSGWAVQSAMADGRGGLLVSRITGAQYDVTPDSLLRVGAILAAVGPKVWLGIRCHSSTCHNVVINPTTRARRILPGPAVKLLTWPWPFEAGAVAPDGSAAAVVVASAHHGMALDLIDLSSGAATRIPVPVNQDSSSQTLVWSPDSKWLFALSASGKLVAVNARSHRVESLGVPLPRFSQLAIG
jgi:hypothetical protein